MDLFDMLAEPDEPIHDELAVVSEIMLIAQQHNVNITEALAIELASIFTDPPPWGSSGHSLHPLKGVV